MDYFIPLHSEPLNILTAVTDECESAEGCDDDSASVRVRAIVQFPSCAAHAQSYANQMRLETHLHTIRPLDHQA